MDRWREATREVLQAGATKDDLYLMLMLEPDATQDQEYRHLPPDDCSPDTMYTELPEGLIDLPSAAKKFDIPVRTIRAWVNRGHLQARGRLKGAARGGGYLVVCEDELTARINGPRDKGGRPPKLVSPS